MGCYLVKFINQILFSFIPYPHKICKGTKPNRLRKNQPKLQKIQRQRKRLSREHPNSAKMNKRDWIRPKKQKQRKQKRPRRRPRRPRANRRR